MKRQNDIIIHTQHNSKDFDMSVNFDRNNGNRKIMKFEFLFIFLQFDHRYKYFDILN